MGDANACLADDGHFIEEQMIVVFVHAAVESVLDRDNRVRSAAFFHRAKHFLKHGAGKDLHVRAEQFARSGMTERAGLALKGGQSFLILRHQRYHPIEPLQGPEVQANREYDLRSGLQRRGLSVVYDRKPESAAR